MTWVVAIVLAAGGFALAAFAFKLARGLYTSLLAALTLGLAGYAMQASPNIPAAPKSAAAQPGEALFDVVEARREMLANDDHSRADMLVVADAMARQGQFGTSAGFLAGITRANPRDFEAWLAEGNALVEHAGGVLTPAALYAYRVAAGLKPDHPAPGYFLGVSLIRQGQMMEARQMWAETLAATPADAAGRDALADRLARLDSLLGLAADGAPSPPPAPEQSE